MTGPIRWISFFSVIVLAGAAITALWSGLSVELLKAVVSFAILATASLALYAIGQRLEN